MNKSELCAEFYKLSSDDDKLLSIVEKISDLKDLDVNCIYKCKTPCSKKSTTLFGLCASHLSTKKGAELQSKWNNVIDQLAEQTDATEATIEETEEDVSVEDVSIENESSESESDEPKSAPDENDIVKTGPGKYHVPLVKTKTGHWIHKKSGIVFNMKTKKAIGKLSEKGDKIYTLEEDDIVFCDKYNIEYVSVL